MKEINTYPVFPLSINVLPGAYLPLQIFEPRYLDMVKSSLAKEEGFCIALTKQDEEAYTDELPNLFEVATYVEIVDFNQLQNGLLGITVKGLDKVKILDRWKQDDELLLAKISKFKELGEDFSEDPAYKEIWSMLTEIRNHPEVKKLNLEIDLKNAINVSYILGSLLPLTPIEKQTMLELENSIEKLDFLKSIIKKLGG
tara:strand:+ start:2073 stop:2669 length:597 start_codon:yes stop_codon:yes gene_type:complete